MGAEVYHHLKDIIKAKYGKDAVNVGDEGGFAPGIQVGGRACVCVGGGGAGTGGATPATYPLAPTHPPLQSNEEGLVLIDEAIKRSGHEGKIEIAMDCAASEFYIDGV